MSGIWIRPSWEEWRQEFRSDPSPMRFALALDGERLVGQSVLQLPQAAGAGAYTGYTGVPHMRTNNDTENPAMLAVNARLGYRMVPGPRRMKKQL